MERERGPLVSLIWTVGMRRKKSQTWTTCLSNMVGCPVKIFDINKILSCHNSMIANFYAPKSTLPRNQMPHHAKSLVGPTCLTSSPRTPPTYPIMRGWYLQTEDIRPFKQLILMGLWCMGGRPIYGNYGSWEPHSRRFFSLIFYPAIFEIFRTSQTHGGTHHVNRLDHGTLGP